MSQSHASAQHDDASGSAPEPAPTSFAEFWPYYVLEHENPINRALHFIGTTASLISTAKAIRRRSLKQLLKGPIYGYGAAWIGHFFVEGNKPASFSYPLWSFLADHVMWWKTLRGQMGEEVEKARAARAARAPST
jgi:hypothetical protein